ncbi:MAG: sensor histidine kinase [Lachnospiraceae bacterium]|nr:sensor histidine kinase [Lachnospiraceae bacterium]
MKKIREYYSNTSLSTKIRISYLLLAVPLVLLIVVCFLMMQRSSRKYSEMIRSAALAGDFSLDFKKDFDYETYLLIVGNKTVEESKLDELIVDADTVVDGLIEITSNTDNLTRLKGVKKYLGNLRKYKSRIEYNLTVSDDYEANIEIWENDVQIVTSLIREEIFQYMFYEIRDMQAEKAEMDRFYNRAMTGTLMSFLILTLMVAAFSIYLPMSFTRPITDLVQVTDRVSKGDLSARSSNDSRDEVGVLSQSMNQMIEKINDLLSQITKEQIRIREAELELLQSQINPHFLYNTLDTIIWLAEGGDEKRVVDMVKSLSAFFRTSLSRGRDMIMIREEILHAKSYLEIQQFRYQDILEYEIDVPNEFGDYMIPKITVQPVVENALYHGIKNKRGGGKITITARKEGEDFVISVADNGIGMTEERLEEVTSGLKGAQPADNAIYGLYNVNERIRLKFGDRYGIRMHSIYNEGSTCDIVLPMKL